MKTVMTSDRLIIRSKRFRRQTETKEPESSPDIARISTLYRPFQPLKWAVLPPEKDCFATQNKSVHEAIIRKLLTVRQMRKVLKTRVFATERPVARKYSSFEHLR